ncbi:TonB-dependent receptor [Elizabethkingia anophelis]|uniref:SusC/RagA family TonB-linked outer membrane protein n=1 Tax=Elizabethkingia TaxID=308865 RepID=UPI000389F80D|nr:MULTISPECIES: TonB-dependent receptor [Elizabethkingia]AQW90993.1 SusC/RagA family TonB-linked outer membrane protein [Elizabethkingia anophelis]AVF47809.1 TonB-dependent receptor [Elizabethkingia anophelis]AVF51801.1 TonB-dependent receptor [Elizabethkingia anophelis]EJC8059167.1 TonB-dependent receptor [Elizabethkingia anophelis]ELB0067971.1 TonB-dependent receptor [Elizabethkingia anophelis]
MRRSSIITQSSLKVAIAFFLCTSYTAIAQQIPLKKENSKKTDTLSRSKDIDEVVVVGFGKQKKVNLTGAVDMVSAKKLENRPITNIGAGLQGLIPNLNITIDNGRATSAANFNVRGFTSVNGGNPLILVDNVPYTGEDLSRLNPADIESVSVLKDAASAAIYGARAAFGVVLITTKSAKGGQLNVSVNTNTAYRTVGKLPELVTDPLTVMQYKHDAATPLYNLFPENEREYARQIANNPNLPRVILSPSDPNSWAYYGSTNWLKEAYNDTAPTFTNNISISRKLDKVGYLLSGEYYRQDGMLRYGNDIYNRYNMRGKVDLNINPWLDLSTNTAFTFSDYDSPVFIDDLFFWNVNRTPSLSVPKNPDGTWTKDGASILGRLQDGGRSKNEYRQTQISFAANASIIKKVWDLKAEATFRNTSSITRSYDIPVTYKTGPMQPISYTGSTTSWARNENMTGKYYVYNVYTDFHKNFGSHYVQLLGGFNQEYNRYGYSSAKRNNIISTSLPSIGLSTGTMEETERIIEWALQGIYYRAAYNFKNKYLLELNGRYDGSSRFPKGHRWGFFPSASAGWVLSDENFFAGAKNTIGLNLLKFRGSYGSLGNQDLIDKNKNTIAYPYIPTMTTGTVGQILGDGRPTAVYAPGAVSDNFTWEKVSTVNFGADLAFFNNRLQLNFDKYTRYTKDMLIPGKILPNVFGASEPKVNAGDLKTKGWEFRLGWNDQFKLAGSPFRYNVAFTLADSRSYITRFDNPAKLLSGYYVGQEIGEIWGAEIEGFFKDEADIKNHPNQTAMGTDDQSYRFYPGDPKFRDRNGDGKVDMGDKTVNNPGDLYVVGNTSARFPFSLDLSGEWKGIDLRIFLQGVGKRDWYPGAGTIYFWGVYAQPWTNVTQQNLDHWTPDNPNGYFPAVRAYTAEDDMQQLGIPNKRYMQDASYVRVKNVTIGYTLPLKETSKINFNKIRFYFSAENIFEISHLKVKLDPETLGQAAYPFQRTYSFGMNLNF